MSDCLPERTVTDIESVITCRFNYCQCRCFIHWLYHRDHAIIMSIVYVCTLRMITLLFTMALYGFKTSHNPFNIGNNWPNYQNKSILHSFILCSYTVCYHYYASCTYTCRYIHVWYFADKLCKVLMNLCKYILHKWLFANYHRRGKIRWAKFL